MNNFFPLKYIQKWLMNNLKSAFYQKKEEMEEKG